MHELAVSSGLNMVVAVPVVADTEHSLCERRHRSDPSLLLTPLHARLRGLLRERPFRCSSMIAPASPFARPAPPQEDRRVFPPDGLFAAAQSRC